MYETEKWLVISSLQLDRLRISWSQLNIAEKKIPKKSAWLGDPGIAEWVNTQNILWGDLHFLYIALNNLFKAITKAPELPKSVKGNGLYEELKTDVKLLRDIHEHWDKEVENLWALKKFTKRHSNIDPRSIGLTPFKKFEAGGLDINEIQSLILKLENELRLN